LLAVAAVSLLATAAAAPARAAVPADLRLVVVADGLEEPVAAVTAGDERLFIVERAGRILVHRHGEVLATPFLDIRPLVASEDAEQGLLGLAFHPRFADNGFFYVAYVRDLVPPDPHRHEKVVARYRVDGTSPDVADPASAEPVMVIEQPFRNHNGGDLQFAPDGTLWIATGDGGGGGDPYGNAQNVDSLLGKLLRVDVDRDDFPANPQRNYGIHEDNPFADGPGADEVWAYGLRNPWRFSLDPYTGDAFVGDVGQAKAEEVTVLPAGEGGLNLGWDCWEGIFPFAGGTAFCPTADEVAQPALTYLHGQGNCSVTGGFRYRGHEIAGLAGQYLFADFCSGRLWLAEEGAGGKWQATLWRQAGLVSSFGRDARGELYVVDLTGRVLAIDSPSSLFFDDFESGGLGAWTRVVAGGG
jgi:hypothetical protein